MMISAFSIALVSAALAAVGVGVWQGVRLNHAFDVALFGLIGALLVGRLLYILNPPPSVAQYYSAAWYLTHIFDFQAGAVAFWTGGLSRGGLLLGAALGAGVVAYRHPVTRDALLWMALIAGVIVSVGMLASGQVVGAPTQLPWSLRVENSVFGYAGATQFHPVPGYMALWAGLIMLCNVVLAWRVPELQNRPLILALALFVGVFFIDFITIDVSRILALSALQWLCLLGGGGLGWLLIRSN